MHVQPLNDSVYDHDISGSIVWHAGVARGVTGDVMWHCCLKPVLQLKDRLEFYRGRDIVSVGSLRIRRSMATRGCNCCDPSIQGRRRARCERFDRRHRRLGGPLRDGLLLYQGSAFGVPSVHSCVERTSSVGTARLDMQGVKGDAWRCHVYS